MTALAPSPGSDRSPQGSAVERKRSLLGFYIAMAVILVTTVAGVVLFKPLRLRYAMYRVRHGDGNPDEWLMICRRAACTGDRAAMRVVVERAGTKFLLRDAGSELAFIDVTYFAAEAQPQLFFEIVSEHDDERVLDVLWEVASSKRNMLPGGPPGIKPTRLSPECVATHFDSVLGSTGYAPYRSVASASLDFMRRRFAVKLVGAKGQALGDGE
jgi:hypothetical protein